MDSLINTWEAHHEISLEINNTVGGTEMKNTLEYGLTECVEHISENVEFMINRYSIMVLK